MANQSSNPFLPIAIQLLAHSYSIWWWVCKRIKAN